jgi:hypothetical protein
LTDCNTSDGTLTELKIARAYVKLCSISDPGASVSLASMGSHEIRMLSGPAVVSDSAPLFWLELFDHHTKTSLDSYCCHRLKDAVPVLSDLFAQMDDLDNSGETCR